MSHIPESNIPCSQIGPSFNKMTFHYSNEKWYSFNFLFQYLGYSKLKMFFPAKYVSIFFRSLRRMVVVWILRDKQGFIKNEKSFGGSLFIFVQTSCLLNNKNNVILMELKELDKHSFNLGKKQNIFTTTNSQFCHSRIKIRHPIMIWTILWIKAQYIKM